MSDTDTIGTEQAASDAEPAGKSAAESAAQDSGPGNGASPRRRGGLTGMVLAELRQLAGELNIPGTASMRKGELIAAIKERQGDGPAGKGPEDQEQGQLSLTSDDADAGSPGPHAEHTAGSAAPVSRDEVTEQGTSATETSAETSAETRDETSAEIKSADSETSADAVSAPVSGEAASSNTAATNTATVTEGVAQDGSAAESAPPRDTASDTKADKPETAKAEAPDASETPQTAEASKGEATETSATEPATTTDSGKGEEPAAASVAEPSATESAAEPTAEAPAPEQSSEQREQPSERLSEQPVAAAAQGEAPDKPQDKAEDKTQDKAEDKTEDKVSAPATGVAEADQSESGTPAESDTQAAAPTQPSRSRRRRSASRPAGSPDATETQSDGKAGNGKAANGRTDEGKAAAKPDEQRNGDQESGDTRARNNREGGNGRDDEEEGGGRRRGRRFRDRNRRNRRDSGGNAEPEIREDDVLLPVAGILDVLDNYAFVRTSGYLSGPNDVYVSLSMVRRYGLRRGDNVSGVVRQPREGEQQRQKFNPLVRVDTINGLDPEQAKNRAEFHKLTPLYPNERLRLETESHKLTTRVIDLVMPVGKGQRALIVSPPKAGKTMILQAIANAITTNNPECHLMVVLVDERPEEVTDMQRSVKGEVIASTFDRPPSDHTTVAELAIERAKRLVEMGHDVVVLLDSITRLGRAYNLAAPASGRILSGGVDSTALYPPKRFLGAARNIEDGGSLTIFATALVETGSTMDTVIFEEFKGTGNAELKLDRKIADKRVFPAIDIDASGTRKEELLLAPDEMAVTVKLRRVLSALDDQQALDLVLTQLRKTRTNIEFLMQVAKNTPSVEE